MRDLLQKIEDIKAAAKEEKDWARMLRSELDILNRIEELIKKHARI